MRRQRATVDSGLDIDVGIDIAGGANVSVRGELDSYSAPQLRSAVRDASLVAPGAVVLDMSAVTFMDSSGLGMLIALAGELSSRRCELIVSQPSDQVWKVIEMTGTHRVVTVQR